MRTVDEAARVLGMKPREVMEVRESPDGDAVLTHDGNWTVIAADGLKFLGKTTPAEVWEPARRPIRVEATVGKPKKTTKG